MPWGLVRAVACGRDSRVRVYGAWDERCRGDRNRGGDRSTGAREGTNRGSRENDNKTVPIV